MTHSRDQVDQGNAEIREVSNKIDISAQDVLQALENSDTTLLNYLDQLHDDNNTTDFSSRHRGGKVFKKKATTLQEYFNQDTDEIDKFYIEPTILQGLVYPGMDGRYENVPKAHAKTYSWIFRHDSVGPWDSFIDWLRVGEQIYWINGKAASGKSTLMKYILENAQLPMHLDVWCADLSLTIVRFYFWATGTQMQKSQIGLFRSMLYQMLSSDSSLIHYAFPELVEELRVMEARAVLGFLARPSWRPWSLDELKEGFYKLLKKTSTSSKFCFLIDGLDEFDGNYLELTSYFKEIAAIRNVKLCVSSRPLLAFDDQLAEFPKLRLQDLTVGDITQYVRDKLMAHPRFLKLAEQEARATAAFVDEIVQTSAGVFLWVNLIVESILQGLTNHDDIANLQRRLRVLPPELDDLYSHMLDSITPPFYLVQCSKLLQLIYQSPEPINVLELSLADDADDTGGWRDTQKQIDTEDIFQRCKQMLPKIKSRCAGLLEVNGEENISISDGNYL